LTQRQIAAEKGITTIEFSDAIDVPERTLYYWQSEFAQKSNLSSEIKEKKQPANKLTLPERKSVEAALLTPEWADLSPREIYYKLLDEKKTVVASVSTFYRIARKRQILTRRSKTEGGKKLNREKPILTARGPNEVWSWDVSQIQSARKSERYYLYVIIDIWSRYVVGWCLERHEKSEQAIQMWKKALEEQMISGGKLINHKDNGSIMTSDEMIKFVHDVGMIDSYSRAGVSDDNPFSESLFRTIKYFRDFPEFFESLEDGRKYFEKYFDDYNFAYRHSGIQFLFPASRHYGEEGKILSFRNKVIQDFYQKNSHRYSSKQKVFKPIVEVKIN
jgi:putative transposase